MEAINFKSQSSLTAFRELFKKEPYYPSLNKTYTSQKNLDLLPEK